jgi:hypothetical protein
MRSGIYLGPPIGRLRPLVWALLLFGTIGSVFHVASYVRARAELSRLRANVEGQQSVGSLGGVSDIVESDTRAVLAQLRAVSMSGVAVTLSPTALLQLIENALPEQVALVSVSFAPSATPASLLMEAIVRREADVSAMQQRISDSPGVTRTEVLGERRSLEGTLFVRLQVELSPAQPVAAP